MSTICGLTFVVLTLSVSHSPTVVREVTERILADPAYEDGVREIVVSEDFARQLGDYLKKILDFLRRVAGGLARLSVDQPVVFWLIMVALVAVLGLILWHLAYSLGLLFRASPASPAGRAEQRARVLRFKELWSEARLLAERGDYSGAIRHLFLALLARAHDSRVRLPAGWTNGEIVAYVSRQRGLRRVADPLGAFVGTFDRIWYGQQTAKESDYTRCEELVSVCVEGLHEEAEEEAEEREPGSAER